MRGIKARDKGIIIKIGTCAYSLDNEGRQYSFLEFVLLTTLHIHISVDNHLEFHVAMTIY